jgi:chromosome segregation ATPase
MNAPDLLRYLKQRGDQIQNLVQQLDEIQVAFNAQFDEFATRHDAHLERMGQEVLERLSGNAPGSIPDPVRAAVEAQLPAEEERIAARRAKLREEYLPQRRQEADGTQAEAQAQLASLRALNPQLDRQEEALKGQKAELEARLAALNLEIQEKSRGLKLVRHFLAITRADRERQRIMGHLEALGKSLYEVRHRWEEESARIQEAQQALQERWQMESIAVARLQTELDQLDDEAFRRDLALRRAVRHVLDGLTDRSSGADPELEAGLVEMIELNRQTDAYHEGLASVGGLIGLLRGIGSSLEALSQSVGALHEEQRMHSAYLKPLDFALPTAVKQFHDHWPELARQFADETAIGQHPAQFAAEVEPLLESTLSQASIERMFNELGAMIQQATARW